MSAFEGSYMGDAARIDAQTKLECGVCWWVYDPTKGDADWQIPAGVAFNDLPNHWRCPKCDAAKAKFMVVGRTDEAIGAAQTSQRVDIAARVAALKAAYLAADVRMRSLPVYNPALMVDAVGFRPYGEDEIVGVIITPWCMNLMVTSLDADAIGRPEGTKRPRAFPSGEYEFVAGLLDGVGPIESCSLFSPMEEFGDMDVAMEVARHAIDGAFETPETAPPPPAAAEPMSRRGFLTGASA